jgi:hypothetical protein
MLLKQGTQLRRNVPGTSEIRGQATSLLLD